LYEDGDLTVDKRVKVSHFVANYKDEILCDVVPMEVCHFLLGDHDNLTRKLSIMVLLTRLRLPIVMEEAQAQAHMQAHQRVDLGQP